jgi:response regulator NasT
LRILIVDDDPRRAQVLREGLEHSTHEIVAEIGPRDDIASILRSTAVDVVLASLSCPDRDVIERFRISSAQMPRPIVMFVDSPGAQMAGDAIRAGVSAYIVDGLAPKRVEPILTVAIARFHEYQGLKEKLHRSEVALADRKVIERAKGLLMAQRGWSEAEAYGWMRGTAMSQGQKIADLAQSILSVADLLKK